MRWFAAVAAALLVWRPAASQTGAVQGTVRWKGQPLAEALVEALRGDTVLARGRSAADGAYRLTLSPGTVSLRVRLVGFEPRVVAGIEIAAGATTTTDVEMEFLPIRLSQIVVAVSRLAEPAIDAPAATSVVDAQTIEERNTVSALDHVVGLTGVDAAVQGLQARQVVARGFNSVFGTSLLLLEDYRDVSIPSLRGNLSTFVTSTNDDLERVEVVRGPASAMYGPNAADGVVHFITKSPFDSPGRSLSLTGGERSLFEGSGRIAQVVSDRVAFRLSGTYVRGREWPAPPAASELTPRDPNIERMNTSARVDVRVSPSGTAIFEIGSTVALRNVEYTTIGTTQVKDWSTSFAQARYTDGRFFAQAYMTLNEAGKSTLLQTGDTVVDHSRFFVAQVQHGFNLGERARFNYGADLQRTTPVTGGTIDGRFENDDVSTQLGAYVQSDARLWPDLHLLAALRADRHDRMKGTVWSPRVGLVFTPAEGQAFRLTFNRAFSTPTSPELFVDLAAGTLGPLPYTLRALGVPEGGLTFHDRCGTAQCMVSPFAPGQSLPLDATSLWPAIVSIMGAQGYDLSGLPAPTSAEVGTVLRTLDLTTGTYRGQNGPVPDVPPLVPTTTSAFEVGYKGLIGGRILVDASVYYTRRRNFIAPLAVVTPNVFLSTADLTVWLSQYMPADQAAALAAGIGGVDGMANLPGIPLGTVGPDGAFGGSDILMTYSNFGRANLWGADLGFKAVLTTQLSLTVGYSHTSRVYFPGRRSGESDISMNAPRNKVALGVEWREPADRFHAAAQVRSVGGFQMLSGVWSGAVPGYTIVSGDVGSAVPFMPGTTVTLAVRNITNRRHSEFFGAPVLGRLASLRLQYRF